MGIRIPPATHVELEVYRHPTLPMGLIEVVVDGKVSARVDGCCPKGGCPGIPANQGFYFQEVVADGLPFKEHRLQLRAVDRDGITTCAQLGNKFDVRSIVAKVPKEKERKRKEVDFTIKEPPKSDMR